MMPRAGGQYVFLREAYGPAVGFLFGWSTFLVVQTGTIAAVAVAFAKFLGVLTDAVSAENYLIRARSPSGGYAVSLSTQQLVAVALIVALTATNMRGPEDGHADPEHVHVHQDGRAAGPDRGRPDPGRQPRRAPRGRRRGGTPRPTAGTPTRCRRACRRPAALALAMLLGRR